MVGAPISRSGILLYTTVAVGGERQESVWVSRAGLAEAVQPGWSYSLGGDIRGFSPSPDQRRLAYTADDAEPGSQDIWIKELPDGATSRLTSSDEMDWGPRWSPDGETVIYSERYGAEVWQRRSDGIGARLGGGRARACLRTVRCHG